MAAEGWFSPSPHPYFRPCEERIATEFSAVAVLRGASLFIVGGPQLRLPVYFGRQLGRAKHIRQIP
jgi:hypothetical protein